MWYQYRSSGLGISFQDSRNLLTCLGVCAIATVLIEINHDHVELIDSDWRPGRLRESPRHLVRRQAKPSVRRGGGANLKEETDF